MTTLRVANLTILQQVLAKGLTNHGAAIEVRDKAESAYGGLWSAIVSNGAFGYNIQYGGVYCKKRIGKKYILAYRE